MLPPAANIDFGIHKGGSFAEIRLQNQLLFFLDCSNRCKTYAKRRVSMSSFGWYRGFVCTTSERRVTAILLQH